MDRKDLASGHLTWTSQTPLPIKKVNNQEGVGNKLIEIHD